MVGIYAFKNTINNKMYIGQSRNIERRKSKHLSFAFNVNTRDYNSPFHRALRKHGKDKFEFIILEECLVSELSSRERYWIELYDALSPKGYNVLPGGYAAIGWKLSKNDVLQIAKALKETSLTYKEIAEAYSVSEDFICSINKGRAWKMDICYPIRKTSSNTSRLSDKNVADIISELKNSDVPMREIAVKYGMKEHCISSINRGRSHKQSGIDYPIRNSKFANKRYYGC